MRYDNRVYLEHIRECLRRIEANTAAGYEAFMASETLQDATLRNLQTMAESTQRLSDEMKGKHPQIDWDRIAAFRNVLTHAYLDIKVERIWATIETEIPRLKAAILELSQAEG